MQEPGFEKRPSSLPHYARIIGMHYPELQGADVRMVEQGGQFNDALIIDDELIIRFPRYAEGVETMRREVAFLYAIRGQTTLPVPDPVYANLDDAPLGEAFMGYRLLAGKPLWRTAVLAQTDEKILDRWAQQLAGFLRELHGITPEAFAGTWTVVDGLEAWQRMYGEIQRHLLPMMRPDARQTVSAHFESFLDDSTLHKFTPAPRHGDFGSGNILTDATGVEISGVIDFEFAGIGDPALDIAAVSTLGEALFGRFAAAYPIIETMLPRARFYRGTYALDEALHGFKNNDKEAFEAGMASYV